jgi:hypothetical protein
VKKVWQLVDTGAFIRLFAICLALLAFSILTGCSNPPPDDDFLIETFESNRSDFEGLVRMMSEDTRIAPLHKVARDYVQYDAGQGDTTIDEQRLQEYRDLFTKLDLLSITHYTRNEESFVITVYAEGWSPEGGIYKGYEYFPDGFPARLEDSLVASLEYNPQVYESGTWLYRKINDNWYLWFLY